MLNTKEKQFITDRILENNRILRHKPQQGKLGLHLENRFLLNLLEIDKAGRNV